jgi:hypothetical protein
LTRATGECFVGCGRLPVLAEPIRQPSTGTEQLAISLIASGRVDVTPLITHHFGLDETKEALLLSSHVSDSSRPSFTPEVAAA